MDSALVQKIEQQNKKMTLAIMCGGKSSRFGTDKGLFVPGVKDKPLFLRAVDLLASDFDKVFIVVRDEQQKELYSQTLERNQAHYVDYDIEIITDNPDFANSTAPLVGLCSALDKTTTSHLFVIPVDQIGVRRLHLKRLWKSISDLPNSDQQAVHYMGENNDHSMPFPSFWPTKKVEVIKARMQANSFSVIGALKDLSAIEIPAAEYEKELSFNANHQSELYEYMGKAISDKFGRRVNYLRFSLTEVCNLSCQYCLPDGSPEWLKQRARIGIGDIESVLRGFRKMGFQKVRFTGGEPTVHNKCFEAIQMARKIGFEQICMTTNGILIDDMKKWADAGLTQLNFSLDTLEDDTFLAMTKSRGVDKVLYNIDAAISEGLKVKVNAVLMRSKNFAEAEDLIRWGIKRDLTLRFIELMPMELNKGFDQDERILNTELMPVVKQIGMHPQGQEFISSTDGPEKVWVSSKLPGKVGFISPLSCNFCDTCNRLRVTSRGALKLCLFGNEDIQLDLSSPESVVSGVLASIPAKPEKHQLEDRNWGNVSTFRTIGG